MSNDLLQQWKLIQLLHVLHYCTCRSRSFGNVTQLQPIIHSLQFHSSRQKTAGFQTIASMAYTDQLHSIFSELHTQVKGPRFYISDMELVHAIIQYHLYLIERYKFKRSSTMRILEDSNSFYEMCVYFQKYATNMEYVKRFYLLQRPDLVLLPVFFPFTESGLSRTCLAGCAEEYETASSHNQITHVLSFYQKAIKM